MGDVMTIESGVAILFALRRRGYSVRKSPDGNIQVAPFHRLREADRKVIVENKAMILAALDGEMSDGARKVDQKARWLLASKKDVPTVLTTENNGEWTYVSCLRRDGSGWTIKIPKEQFDPFRLTEALIKVDKELVLT
jgi:hypothetical protein